MNSFKAITFATALAFLSGCINSNSLNKFNINKIEMDKDVYPVVIIGGGFGGLTSGMYLAQANIKHILLEGETPGGAITLSHSVCNWPGEKNISGPDLAAKIEDHSKSSGSNIVSNRVRSVDFSVWPYLIKTNDNKTIKALSCIIGTGATPIFLNIPGEDKYFGRGVSKCATCDGPFYKNKTVAVIGGGNTAITDASYLSNIVKKLYLVVRRDKLRAMGKAVDTLIAKPNVEILYNTNVKEVIGDGQKVTKLKIFNNKTDSISYININGMFLAIGSKPNSQIFENQLELDKDKHIIVNNGQETSIKGIFAAGDVCEPEFKQLVIASGDGAKAAMQVQKFLDEIGYTQIKVKPSVIKQAKKTKSSAVKQAKKEELTPRQNITKKSNDHENLIELKNVGEFKDEVLSYKGNVFVDFYAHWCAPCKMMMPIVEKLSKEFSGKVKFVKADVSQIQALGAMWSVRGVPTFIFFKNGKEIRRFSGGRAESDLRNIIKSTF